MVGSNVNELPGGCVVCGPGPDGIKHRVDEGMFRIGETFGYHECTRCGSLQITDVPTDLGRYYDFNAYYSYTIPSQRLQHPVLAKAPIRQALRLNTALYLRTGLGRGVGWARIAGIAPHDRILDIGCGGGQNLRRLHLYGYRNLVGADPFLDVDREACPGVPLLKRAHSDVGGVYDWVMLHHTFEHVPDPRSVLASARRLLTPAGGLLVRMPVMGTYAWRHYGPLWVQVDAPRHLVLFTVDGFRDLAAEEGFRMERIVFDSTGFQFWGSEMVAAEEPHYAGPARRFVAADLERWEAEAVRLNAALDGDQAIYVLRVA
jgi:SAM-dependent methyltransferase